MKKVINIDRRFKLLCVLALLGVVGVLVSVNMQVGSTIIDSAHPNLIVLTLGAVMAVVFGLLTVVGYVVVVNSEKEFISWAIAKQTAREMIIPAQIMVVYVVLMAALLPVAIINDSATKMVIANYETKYGVYVDLGNAVYKVEKSEPSEQIEMADGVSVETLAEKNVIKVGYMKCEKTLRQCNEILAQNKEKILSQFAKGQSVVFK